MVRRQGRSRTGLQQNGTQRQTEIESQAQTATGRHRQTQTLRHSENLIKLPREGGEIIPKQASPVQHAATVNPKAQITNRKHQTLVVRVLYPRLPKP